MIEGMLQERVRVRSTEGYLAGELAYPSAEAHAACLLVNPHPYMGGGMANNVVAALAAGLAQAGAVTLRFDYAGVGESEGERIDVVAGMAEFWSSGVSPQDPAMLQDVYHAAAWLRSTVSLPMVLIGYSFGAHAIQPVLDDTVAAAILVAPTVGRHDFSTVARWSGPRLVVCSDRDFSSSPENLAEWRKSLDGSVSWHQFQGSDHFLKGREERLLEVCRSFLCERGVFQEAAPCPCS